MSFIQLILKRLAFYLVFSISLYGIINYKNDSSLFYTILAYLLTISTYLLVLKHGKEDLHKYVDNCFSRAKEKEKLDNFYPTWILLFSFSWVCVFLSKELLEPLNPYTINILNFLIFVFIIYGVLKINSKIRTRKAINQLRDKLIILKESRKDIPKLLNTIKKFDSQDLISDTRYLYYIKCNYQNENKDLILKELRKILANKNTFFIAQYICLELSIELFSSGEEYLKSNFFTQTNDSKISCERIIEYLQEYKNKEIVKVIWNQFKLDDNFIEYKNTHSLERPNYFISIYEKLDLVCGLEGKEINEKKVNKI